MCECESECEREAMHTSLLWVLVLIVEGPNTLTESRIRDLLSRGSASS